MKAMQRDEADEAYRVYSAVLESKYENAERKVLVIVNATYSNSFPVPVAKVDQQNLLKRLSPLTEETLNDYSTQNVTSYELSDRFDVKTQVVLVDDERIKKIFGQNLRESWESFYNQFPDSGGYTRFSNVGFNTTKDQALIFVTHSCGSLCASGIYYLLVKENGEWKVEKEALIWVS